MLSQFCPNYIYIPKSLKGCIFRSRPESWVISRVSGAFPKRVYFVLDMLFFSPDIIANSFNMFKIIWHLYVDVICIGV